MYAVRAPVCLDDLLHPAFSLPIMWRFLRRTQTTRRLLKCGLGSIVSPPWGTTEALIYRLFLDARRRLGGPAVHLNGYNFSNQGLLGIWDGFSSSFPPVVPSSPPRAVPDPLLDPLIVDGVQSISRTQSRRGKQRAEVPSDFAAALLLLSAYNQANSDPLDSADWKPTIPTSKLIQRRFALQLCGWSLKNEDISAVINK